jgi:diadenosine tetraphosphate (Ap4A) HIT family hydrolase
VPDPSGSPASSGSDCVLCERIALIDAGEYPFAVARLSTGYVNLMESQYYEGTTEFVCRVCTAELHQLDPAFRAQYLVDMSRVAEAVWRAFGPRKLNYEALGNAAPHLHWRIIPRLPGDPNPRGPIWENQEFVALMQAGESTPSPDRLEVLKSRLITALNETAAAG